MMRAAVALLLLGFLGVAAASNAAGEAFLRRERTLGIPGVHLSVIQWVGPSSSLHLHERSRQLYEEVFEGTYQASLKEQKLMKGCSIGSILKW